MKYNYRNCFSAFFFVCVAEHVRKTFYYVLLFSVAIGEKEGNNDDVHESPEPPLKQQCQPLNDKHFGIKFHFVYLARSMYESN